jgi:L-lactate dehydrogenase
MSGSGKIVIIGAGHVGSHCAYSLAAFGIGGEIVLLDKIGKLAHAQAADIADGVTRMPYRPIVREGGYDDCADADIVVMAAGVAYTPGMTRLDMLADTVAIMQDILPRLCASGFSGVLISISNPADIIADYLRKGLNLPEGRVFSTGTALDSARLIRTLSERYGVGRGSVHAFSMGEHGDSQMIPFSAISIGGVPLYALDANPPRKLLLERTRMIGMEIVGDKACTDFGIGMTLCDIAKAVRATRNGCCPFPLSERRITEHPVFHAGVPCVIGRGGVESIIEIHLTDAERAAFLISTDVIAKAVALAATL